MSKKYWTYDLTKVKKSGAKFLNQDLSNFLGYADGYSPWAIKKFTKADYQASMKGFKNYGKINYILKGKSLKSSKAKVNTLNVVNKKIGSIKMTNLNGSADFNGEIFVSTSAKINKKLIGSEFSDNFTFGGGNDYLDGKKGNDKLYGMGGNDTLKGGSGNDYLDGGKGKDNIIGGKGKDTFMLNKGKGYDLIKDFEDKKDKITFGAFPTKSLKLKNKKGNAYIYYVGEGNDLLAKVKGAAGKLSSKGTYLV